MTTPSDDHTRPSLVGQMMSVVALPFALLGPLTALFLALFILSVPAFAILCVGAVAVPVAAERMLASVGVSEGVRGYGLAVAAFPLFFGGIALIQPSDSSPMQVVVLLAISIGLFAYGLMLADDF